MKELIEYMDSWTRFKSYCDDKIKKSDCYLNNKNWEKLREWHMEDYLTQIEQPFHFLFELKYYNRKTYESIKCLPRLYHEYKRKREIMFFLQNMPNLTNNMR